MEEGEEEGKGRKGGEEGRGRGGGEEGEQEEEDQIV
jgi:hypothetical protein